jgi:enoyl-CoA hydratase/carnithine racemase
LGFKQVQYGLPLTSVAFHIARKEITLMDSLYECLLLGKVCNPAEALHSMMVHDYVDEDAQLYEKAYETVTTFDLKNGLQPFSFTKKYLKAKSLIQMRQTEVSNILDEKFVEQMHDETVRERISKLF